jgi:two-component system osmolarity sensor histidine kinase EnvZ
MAVWFVATLATWVLSASWGGWLAGRDAAQTDAARAFGALAAAGAVTLATAALTAWWVSRPYRALSQAAQRLRECAVPPALDEQALVQEIREVNAGFNRMAAELARAEQDRAVMLAGLSHDLRTPLARLRLEAELSVSEPQALAHMAADIGQLDAIIDKFTDYARPDVPKLQAVDLRQQVEAACRRFDGDSRLHIVMALPNHLVVRADPIDLDRVLVNLLENAARYGRGRDGGPAELTVSAHPEPQEVALLVRDKGPGVPEAQLGRLTQPFFRGNAARSEPSGAGLGLAIVERAVKRMRGALTLRNLPGQGLEACIRLPRVYGDG